MDSKLLTAVKKIYGDRELTKEFLANPSQTIKDLGLDPDHYHYKALEGRGVGADVSGCVSIGCVVCGSVGS
ncbi:hypothetical protein [Aureispira anguillae]|uniref:Uncharacterized protein n=1 Tax=Aureispira anguillae TaxID=2864201 RepID=A0A915YI19_9BACT|nr:hypothetical protein [Aureispira anguillae]BDS13559.1 hypothetical protein AsAng_0042980 [Aureispira anguillae]